MRARLRGVIDLLALGLTAAEVVAELPDVEPADVAACVRFARRRVDHPVLAA